MIIVPSPSFLPLSPWSVCPCPCSSRADAAAAPRPPHPQSRLGALPLPSPPFPGRASLPPQTCSLERKRQARVQWCPLYRVCSRMKNAMMGRIKLMIPRAWGAIISRPHIGNLMPPSTASPCSPCRASSSCTCPTGRAAASGVRRDPLSSSSSAADAAAFCINSRHNSDFQVCLNLTLRSFILKPMDRQQVSEKRFGLSGNSAPDTARRAQKVRMRQLTSCKVTRPLN